MAEILDERGIRRWWELERNNGALTEIRAIGNGITYSGYFKNIDNLIKEIKPLTDLNLYYVLNSIDEACYSREQCEIMVKKPKNTTQDKEIIGRDFIVIDLDPIRPTGINATEEEFKFAKDTANRIYLYLRNEGFQSLIINTSGNGVHIKIPIKLLNTEENTELIKKFLNQLSVMFSDENVDVDTTCFNASRLIKIPYTFSRKGVSNSRGIQTDRPQRQSQYVRIPDEIKFNDKAYVEKVANLYPIPEQPSKFNNFSTDRFDLDAFIAKYNINIRNKVVTKDFTKYVLEECPFDSNHKAPDSALFLMSNGAIGFKCLHHSCSQYGFKDFRLHFDPNSYDKKSYAEFKHKQQYYGNYKREPFVPQKENETIGKKWLSMSDIQYVDISKLISIPTGYEMLDKKIVGLMLGDISVLSGTSGSGKTSWIDCLTLNVISRGFNVAIWSGELQDFRFQGWINQIAAGKSFVRKKEGYDNFYYTPKNISEKINLWLDKKLFLYNNQYGNKWQQLFSDIKDVVEKENVQLVVLDNLMALNIDGYDGDKYSQQTRFINDLKEYAKIKNVHILLVCHPRKEMGFLRKESISGTADLTNLADNVFIIHRVGKDFETRGTEFFGEDKIREYSVYSSVVEVAKNRSVGVVDLLVGMYYELETRRLKNTIDEHIIYGWQEEPKQQSLMDMDEQDFLSPRENMDCPF